MHLELSTSRCDPGFEPPSCQMFFFFLFASHRPRCEATTGPLIVRSSYAPTVVEVIEWRIYEEYRVVLHLNLLFTEYYGVQNTTTVMIF